MYKSLYLNHYESAIPRFRSVKVENVNFLKKSAFFFPFLVHFYFNILSQFDSKIKRKMTDLYFWIFGKCATGLVVQLETTYSKI